MGKKRAAVKTIFKLLLAISLALVICSFPFHYFEALTYDARFHLDPFGKKNQLIKLIAIDPITVQKMKREIVLKDYTNLVNNLAKAKPAYVVSLIPFEKLKATPKEKIEFVSAISKIPNFIATLDDVIMKGEESKLILPAPFSNIKKMQSVITYDKSNYAGDSVSRRALIMANGYWMMQPYVAQHYNGITNPWNYRGARKFKEDYIQTNIAYHKPDTYKKTSFIDVVDKKINLSNFTDKIVIIGYDDKFTPENYIKTPYTQDVVGMSKLEAQADVIQTFIENNGIVKLPAWVNFISTFLFSLIVLFAVFRLSPFRGLIVIATTLGSFLFISWALFAFFSIAIGMAQPILASFACYYFFIPYRLIQENKRFWELTQRNKLLMQVEELKNNFLSMMSHDLKTPLARIQGMTDIALTSSSNLSPSQKDALQTIKQSTDELTEFISSILDLSRVEYQQIKLNLQSRDVNRLLEEVINKHKFLALERNIEIVTEFEPLFTVKVDADLMKQVFSNLIENAIKYSSSDSRVLVTTEELNGHIIVQVADQGIGISETEIKSIFTKFYRTKDVKNSQIKGSGLGLYLAKYFVELHKGRIAVESLPQQGSTFTVDLPMDL